MQNPALRQLMGTYFHQDWSLFGDNHAEVVATFVSDEPELGQRLPTEIDEVLRLLPSDDDVEGQLRAMGCQIRITCDGGYRAWLAEIAAHARRISARENP